MQLTAHFSVEQLSKSSYASRHGIDNTPNDETVENLKSLAMGLERVITAIGRPITLSSAYRSPKVNSGVGGSGTSYHMRGLAADIEVDGMTPMQVCEALRNAKDSIQYDKIIKEFDTPKSSGWCHIQFPDGEAAPRLTEWTINTSAQGYLPGLVAA